MNDDLKRINTYADYVISKKFNQNQSGKIQLAHAMAKAFLLHSDKLEIEQSWDWYIL
jgi:hypothetical protein